MPPTARGFAVGAPSSGAGKTTITLGATAALRRRGLAVQPFKCGPDFIDGGHLGRASGRICRNLDGWMLAPEVNRQIFYRAAQGADLCILEGVMGLFDGVDGRSEAGSTAEMAKQLCLPVILVADASAAARSAAAVVRGFEIFDPDTRVAGVIFNKVGGSSHERLLRDAVRDSCDAAVLGCVPRDDRIRIPERYLGLFTVGEDLVNDAALAAMGNVIENNVDLDALVKIAAEFARPAEAVHAPPPGVIRIGVARDRAFCFYYEDNLDALRTAGAELVIFSPMHDPEPPPRIDALYFGGGYPELCVEQLAANRTMLASISKLAAEGLPIYAECGGLMYLAEEIVGRDGAASKMAGVLPLRVQMTEGLVKFGYAEICFTEDCILGRKGARARGHSFHCSDVTETGSLERVCKVRYSLSGREEWEGFRVNNVLASYIHLHFLSNPELAPTFLASVASAL